MRKRILMSSVLLASLSQIGWCAWSTNSSVNNLVTNANSNQKECINVSDGTGGVFVFYTDYSQANSSNIMVKRLDEFGSPVFGPTVVCDIFADCKLSDAVSDGGGNAIVTWLDQRTCTVLGGCGLSKDDVYAQKIDASGAALWTANGLAVCTAASAQYAPKLISDGSGGAIFAWGDARTGIDADVYCQKINSSGVAQWTANGVLVCNATGDQLNAVLTPDGQNGAIIAWQDARNGSANNDIYARRVNSLGSPQWTANGVVICNATGQQRVPKIVNYTGGGIIAWEDARGANTDIYAQRIVTSTGVVSWAANGVIVCNATNNQVAINMVNAGTSTILCWFDPRTNANYDIYTQKLINSTGAVQWTANGVNISTGNSNLNNPKTMVDDGSGGAVIAWITSSGSTYNTMAQNILSTGVKNSSYPAAGRVVCNSTGAKQNITMVSDGLGDFIVTWSDFRTGATTGYDLYAQRILNTGALGRFGATDVGSDLNSSLSSVRVFPNPSYGSIKVAANEKIQEVRIFDLSGRQVKLISDLSDVQIDLNLSGLNKGVYLLEASGNDFKERQKIVLK